MNIWFNILWKLFQWTGITAHKMKFSIKEFFSKYDQIHSLLRIWWHLLKKFLMGNFIFREVHFIFSDKICFLFGN